MKKNKIYLLITIALSLGISGCASQIESALSNMDPNSFSFVNSIPSSDKASTTSYFNSESSQTNTVSDSPEYSTSIFSSSTSTSEEEEQIEAYINEALEKLDELINPVIEQLTDERLKEVVQNYYDTEKAAIKGIKDLESAEKAVEKVIEDTKAFVSQTFVPLLVQLLNIYLMPLIAEIEEESLRLSVIDYYEAQIEILRGIENIEEIPAFFESVVENAVMFVAEKLEEEESFAELKALALEGFDLYVEALLENIVDEDVKDAITEFYAAVREKIQSANSLEELETTIAEINEDLMAFMLMESKNIIALELGQYVVALIEEIPDESVKAEVYAFYEEQLEKLNSVETLEDLDLYLEELKNDVLEYALTELKKINRAELDAMVEEALNELPDEELKQQLMAFYESEIEKLLAVDSIDEMEPVLNEIIEDLIEFISGLIAAQNAE